MSASGPTDLAVSKSCACGAIITRFNRVLCVVELGSVIVLGTFIAPQAQLFETAKDRRVKTKALFKQVVKFKQIDPFGPF